MQASGVGDGGFMSVSAGGDLNMAGNILAKGSSDATDGGSGGDVLIDANGSVTVGGRIEVSGSGQDAVSANGFSVDGDGGSIDISAGTFITMNGPMFGIAKGFGQGDEFSFDAIGNVTFGAAAEIDMSADNFSGDITVLSDALVTVNSRLRSLTNTDAPREPGKGGSESDFGRCVSRSQRNRDYAKTG